MGRENLSATGFGWAEIEPTCSGVIGRPDRAPFDRILVSAQARRLPAGLVEQLDDGGRLVMPVSGTLLLLERHGEERIVSRHGHYRFVPLLAP
jgi:protein-L-isoaspartate(D-aspartate) O-methyltransferase